MSNPLRALTFCLSLVFAVPIACRGQSRADAKVGAIHLKGLDRFTEAQVLPLINIPYGSSFDPSRLDAAAQALGATGAFEEVRYSYRPDGGAVSVDFLLKETSRFRRCTFDNFPFATDDEIQNYIRDRVPLYDGSAPDSGSILDDVSSALESLAKARGISATVERISHGALGGAGLEYLFRLAGPAIKIARVQFNGTQGIPESELLREAGPLKGRDYSVVGCREFARSVFVPHYRERGFLKAKVGESSARPLQRQEGSDSYEVQVEFPVTEGSVYVWDGAQWQGNHFLPADQLTALVALKSGDVANDKKIDASWEDVVKEYSRHGYIETQINPTAIFDDAGRKVQFQVKVKEGPQFRMGTFTPRGFTPAIAEKLQSRWKLKAGEIFDASYLSDFLKEEVAVVLAGSSSKSPKITASYSPDPAQLTVNVLLRTE